MNRSFQQAVFLSFLIFFCVPAYSEEEAKNSDIPLAELRNFVQAFEQISKGYVEEINDKTLLERAIEGLLASLDPHSAYLNEERLESLEQSSSGEFSGLGIEIGMEDGYVKVISPIDDTPAQKAGIIAGDLILKIDDQLVRGLKLYEAIELMRGEKGTKIDLLISREGIDKPLEFTIIRDTITTKSVRFEMLEPTFGYVRIAQFQENTGKQFISALEQLMEDKLSGLIIDLRNNPGGLLMASLDVVDALISEGLIVYTEGRLPSSSVRFEANAGDLLEGLPIVVLINGGSASASEIVAGALQDHQRAIIVGTQSFGKGSVQTVLHLDESRGIKLTTARYFTPNGRSIQAEGITPDIEIKAAKISSVDDTPFVQEKDLSGHLENSQTTKSDKKDETADIEDIQLLNALNLLKGVVLLSGTKIQANVKDEPQHLDQP